MKIPELQGNWSVLEVRRITWKTKKNSRKQNGKVPPKFLKNILVVKREKTYGETGGNYLLKPTGNGRHFAGRYSWWTPRQKIPSLTNYYWVTNYFFPVIHELITWNTGLETGNTSPSWVSQCMRRHLCPGNRVTVVSRTHSRNFGISFHTGIGRVI